MAGHGAPKGNRYAAKDNRAWGDMVRRKVAQNPDKLEKAVLSVLDQAAEGVPWAVTELRNTLDGKPVQQVDMSGSMNMTKTYRDLTDEALAEIAAQALHKSDTRRKGETVQ